MDCAGASSSGPVTPVGVPTDYCQWTPRASERSLQKEAFWLMETDSYPLFKRQQVAAKVGLG
jgi:hypothetical protein